jgi:hypothetical protein
MRLFLSLIRSEVYRWRVLGFGVKFRDAKSVLRWIKLHTKP